ncbi:uncharacterized protein MYCFIDRAFT_212558 [Pseudocercospora fijiensis CIRAD86]|uniref:Cytochrome b5 heme-binding domain-containing protein n=1 Tax=Pseudocercospora fijiensis (strain CIRAD86) TaxID=383855 RepID=M2ZFA5_PSEFD|nr:uncharacterized protein MYCFIDRAFT_212558 [Pseudocercospora fijiensis CIRAD86]EME77789.1 hypothetical protein MYCFIDRAFT_212558 [Pseudocercospora fijiensis CIRAD86]
MAEVRARKPVPKACEPTRQPEEEDKSKTKRPKQSSDVDLEPNIFVVAGMFLAFTLVLGSIFYYKVDNRSPPGPFASWVNEKYPWIDNALNRPRASAPAFGAQAQEVTGQISLTEEDLKAYDGTDPEKPIYLGINGTIFDVSASPAFYGPRGHYNHFVGKDATRAWVTECWDEAEQFTWRMEDVEVMFMPKWMDEMLQGAASGDYEGDLAALEAMPKEMIANMAAKAIERFGEVTEEEKLKRRVQDEKEALEKVEETLAHWVKFFRGNAKYQEVGNVVRDETRPAPPKPCEAAMKKRPMKGGKLESIMAGLGPMMGGQPAPGGKGGAAAGGMPTAVKDKLEAAKKKAEQAKEKAKETVEELFSDDEEDLVHEEL